MSQKTRTIQVHVRELARDIVPAHAQAVVLEVPVVVVVVLVQMAVPVAALVDVLVAVQGSVRVAVVAHVNRVVMIIAQLIVSEFALLATAVARMQWLGQFQVNNNLFDLV